MTSTVLDWPKQESFSLWHVGLTAVINHQPRYRRSSIGYYIMSMGTKALQQCCLVCILCPACTSAVLIQDQRVTACWWRLAVTWDSCSVSLWRPVRVYEIHILKLCDNKLGMDDIIWHLIRTCTREAGWWGEYWNQMLLWMFWAITRTVCEILTYLLFLLWSPLCYDSNCSNLANDVMLFSKACYGINRL